MFNGKRTPASTINHICTKIGTKSFVPLDHCYLALLCYLFTNTVKCTVHPYTEALYIGCPTPGTHQTASYFLLTLRFTWNWESEWHYSVVISSDEHSLNPCRQNSFKLSRCKTCCFVPSLNKHFTFSFRFKVLHFQGICCENVPLSEGFEITNIVILPDR